MDDTKQWERRKTYLGVAAGVLAAAAMVYNAVSKLVTIERQITELEAKHKSENWIIQEELKLIEAIARENKIQVVILHERIR